VISRRRLPYPLCQRVVLPFLDLIRVGETRITQMLSE
jgi:hypothetical protein